MGDFNAISLKLLELQKTKIIQEQQSANLICKEQHPRLRVSSLHAGGLRGSQGAGQPEPRPSPVEDRKWKEAPKKAEDAEECVPEAVGKLGGNSSRDVG